MASSQSNPLTFLNVPPLTSSTASPSPLVTQSCLLLLSLYAVTFRDLIHSPFSTSAITTVRTTPKSTASAVSFSALTSDTQSVPCSFTFSSDWSRCPLELSTATSGRRKDAKANHLRDFIFYCFHRKEAGSCCLKHCHNLAFSRQLWPPPPTEVTHFSLFLVALRKFLSRVLFSYFSLWLIAHRGELLNFFSLCIYYL